MKIIGFFCGFQGDPTYLVVEKDKTLATFGINAVCTHLGCVVPWNQAEKKFICPCHGSQYNDQGRVVRGPAPLVSQTDFSQRTSLTYFRSWKNENCSFNQQLVTVDLIFDSTLITIFNCSSRHSHWLWLTATLMTGRWSSFHGSKQISEPEMIHGGLNC